MADDDGDNQHRRLGYVFEQRGHNRITERLANSGLLTAIRVDGVGRTEQRMVFR